MIAKNTLGFLLVLWFYTGLMFGHNLAKYTRKTTQSKLIACSLLIASLGYTVYIFR